MPTLTTNSYRFQRVSPTTETARRAYDDADLNRAIEAHRFFNPTVSGRS